MVLPARVVASRRSGKATIYAKQFKTEHDQLIKMLQDELEVTNSKIQLEAEQAKAVKEKEIPLFKSKSKPPSAKHAGLVPKLPLPVHEMELVLPEDIDQEEDGRRSNESFLSARTWRAEGVIETMEVQATPNSDELCCTVLTVDNGPRHPPTGVTQSMEYYGYCNSGRTTRASSGDEYRIFKPVLYPRYLDGGKSIPQSARTSRSRTSNCRPPSQFGPSAGAQGPMKMREMHVFETIQTIRAEKIVEEEREPTAVKVPVPREGTPCITPRNAVSASMQRHIPAAPTSVPPLPLDRTKLSHVWLTGGRYNSPRFLDTLGASSRPSNRSRLQPKSQTARITNSTSMPAASTNLSPSATMPAPVPAPALTAAQPATTTLTAPMKEQRPRSAQVISVAVPSLVVESGESESGSGTTLAMAVEESANGLVQGVDIVVERDPDGRHIAGEEKEKEKQQDRKSKGVVMARSQSVAGDWRPQVPVTRESGEVSSSQRRDHRRHCKVLPHPSSAASYHTQEVAMKDGMVSHLRGQRLTSSGFRPSTVDKLPNSYRSVAENNRNHIKKKRSGRVTVADIDNALPYHPQAADYRNMWKPL
jgi:hypothetical protein